jgi:hypothetical protein
MSSAGSHEPRGPRRIGPPPPEPPVPAFTEPVPRGRAVAFAIFGLTVVQLVLALVTPALPQFSTTAFDARLYTYPILMLLPPVVWWLVRRRTGGKRQMPWAGFALLMMPFLIDVTANGIDLYSSVIWWHDFSEVLNWFLLGLGAGVLLLRSPIRQAWVLGMLVTGIGALATIGWEVAQWVTLIRNGSAGRDTYLQTLLDETLGTLGAAVAGVGFWIWHWRRRKARRKEQPPSPNRPGLRLIK